MIMPVSGDVLMPFTAESTIYFATLDQYKANPALVISASEGSNIVACADAQVVSIYNDVQIGQAVTLDLGNGYYATYGQLENIQLSEGQFINQGDLIGTIATPTIYYSVEGSNLYFAVNKDGSPINPESLVK